jgi:hypothetical protein
MLFSSLLSVAVLFGTALSTTNFTVLLQYPACAVSPCPMLQLEASTLTRSCRPSVLVQSWQSPNAHCLIFHNVYVLTRLYNMPLQFVSSVHAISRNKLVCSSVSHQNLCLGSNFILMREQYRRPLRKIKFAMASRSHPERTRQSEIQLS